MEVVMNKPAIVYLDEIETIECKRLYVPIKIVDTCPECGITVTRNLNSDYISYPVLNRVEQIELSHSIEDDEQDYERHSWTRSFIIRVTMEYVE
jgi:hypothetical protein